MSVSSRKIEPLVLILSVAKNMATVTIIEILQEGFKYFFRVGWITLFSFTVCTFSDKVTFIDYEYGCFTYEAFDIADHFQEFCGRYIESNASYNNLTTHRT